MVVLNLHMNTKHEASCVAIVGRPNVGKSSLFNRISGRRGALIDKTPGVTRDRLYASCQHNAKNFTLIDTGGLDFIKDNRISSLIRKQIDSAINEAEILIFVCDVQSGVTPLDEEVASMLRKTGKKIFLAVNKVDNVKLIDTTLDFYQLGLGKPYPISSLTSLGIAELLDDIVVGFQSVDIKDYGEDAVKVAIAGRPNVGKSSFLNAILNEERVIVDDRPGTTRDVIDTYFTKNNHRYILLDTAGIRHEKKFKEPLDFFSTYKTKNAIGKADMVVILIDGFEGIKVEDLKICDFVVKERKPLVIVVNKWDLVKDISRQVYKDAIYKRAPFLRNFPVLFTSAIKKEGILNVIDCIRLIFENDRKKISTPQLNKFLENIKKSSPVNIRVLASKLFYITQVSSSPPSFLIFVTNPKDFNKSFLSFLERSFVNKFDLIGTQIQISFRQKK